MARLGVRNRVAQIISQMFDCISKFHGTPSTCYLIPLSTHDQRQLSEAFNQPTGRFVQFVSRSSLIVHNDNFIYKYVPGAKQQNTLFKLCANKALSEFVISPRSSIQFDGRLTFFQFEMMPYLPLSSNQAFQCLMKFITGVYFALSELHSKYNLAHLDLRLENICFNMHYQPVLIDLDRALIKDKPAGTVLGTDKIYGDSLLYSKPSSVKHHEWTLLHSDFKQLGKSAAVV